MDGIKIYLSMFIRINFFLNKIIFSKLGKKYKKDYTLSLLIILNIRGTL